MSVRLRRFLVAPPVLATVSICGHSGRRRRIRFITESISRAGLSTETLLGMDPTERKTHGSRRTPTTRSELSALNHRPFVVLLISADIPDRNHNASRMTDRGYRVVTFLCIMGAVTIDGHAW